MLERLLRAFGRDAGSQSAVNPLREFANSPRCVRLMNKWDHYFDVYHRHLQRFRGKAITMIEIGVFNGGSLHMWRDYLGPKARIVGVDINPGCVAFAEPGTEIIIGDQTDRDFLRKLGEHLEGAEVLLDDGGHTMTQQIATFEEMYPHLHPEGVYICEDLHTSYLAEFGGGYGKAGTYLEFAKTLVDRLNAAHNNGAGPPPDDFTIGTDSLHFYDSMLVIERHARSAPESKVYGSKAEFRYIAPSVSGA